MSVLGVESGALLHVAAATLGVSALVAASPAALLAVKVAGAAYLLWVGFTSLRRRPDELALDAARGAGWC